MFCDIQDSILEELVIEDMFEYRFLMLNNNNNVYLEKLQYDFNYYFSLIVVSV